MISEAITRNDLTAILNEVLPFSFTEFRYHKGTSTVPTSTLLQVHSETFESGSWLILTTLEVITGGGTAQTGQNRILVDGSLIYAHKDIADTSIVNTNFYFLASANNTTVTLETFQASGNSQTQEWTFTAIRIGDKFAQGEADYIVEQGTNGSWKYRKWNSGKIEAWGSQSYGSLVGAEWTSPIYYTDQTVTIPNGIFSSAPTYALATAIGNQWSVWGTIISSSTAISIRMTKPTSSSQTASVALYVVGV